MFSFGYFPGVWILKTDVSEIYRFHLHKQVREKFSLHLPMKMEAIESSETSAFKTQTLGKYPNENMLHKKHGESLKSRYRTPFFSPPSIPAKFTVLTSNTFVSKVRYTNGVWPTPSNTVIPQLTSDPANEIFRLRKIFFSLFFGLG